MVFAVEVDGVERVFTTLREARVVADETGAVVSARRVAVEPGDGV